MHALVGGDATGVTSGAEGRCVLENAIVVHHDGPARLALAFHGDRVGEPGPGAYRIDLSGHVIYPGFINAHDHLHLNNVPRVPHRGFFANSYEWIATVAAHRERPDVMAAIEVPEERRHWHGALKNLLSGATTVVHHDPWHQAFDDPCFPVTVPRNLAWCHSLGLGSSGTTRYGPPVADSFAAVHGKQPWTIHLAEGTDDVAAGELRELDALGCLAANTVLVHAVALSPADVERVVNAGAHVVWCPASNEELLGRTLDPRPLLAAGRLTLGTDSRLTGSRDILAEMQVAAGYDGVDAGIALRLVTSAASATFHLRDAGMLSAGMRADCVILRSRSDEPARDLVAASRADLRAVVKGGRPMIGDPDLAGWFAHAGVPTIRITLDGRPKLIAASAARSEALALEPGVQIGW